MYCIVSTFIFDVDYVGSYGCKAMIAMILKAGWLQKFCLGHIYMPIT